MNTLSYAWRSHLSIRSAMFSTSSSSLNKSKSSVEMKVKDIALKNKDRSRWTVDSNATVFDATRRMVECNVGALCVTKNNKVVGIVTERDYLRKIVHEGRTSKNTNVSEIATMGPNLVVASVDDTLRDCLDVMGIKSIRHLPVVDNSQGNDVVALISISDIARALCKQSDLALKTLDKMITDKDMPIHDG